jgi:hypothetical protein
MAILSLLGAILIGGLPAGANGAARQVSVGSGTPSLSGGARLASVPNATGFGAFWIVQPDGEVLNPTGAASPLFGSLPGLGISVNDIVGIATTPDGGGYWLVGSDGGVFAFGDATYVGSMGGKPLNDPVVAMAASPDGLGYWLVASDGGVFAFGDSSYLGSMGGKPLAAPMVDITADPSGGYWLVASDGGIFNFGSAPFFGSMAGTPLAGSIVGVASSPGGAGYWLVSTDGGVFAFGAAPFFGSEGNSFGPLPPMIGFYSSNGGTAYTVVDMNGTQYRFGSYYAMLFG